MLVAMSLLWEPWISLPSRWYCQEFLGVRDVLCCEGHGCSKALSPGLVSAEQKLGTPVCSGSGPELVCLHSPLGCRLAGGLCPSFLSLAGSIPDLGPSQVSADGHGFVPCGTRK